MAESWTSPVTTMDAVTLPSLTSGGTDGTSVDLRDVMTDHAVQVTVTYATNDQWLVTLQGSLDGASWFDMGGSYTGSYIAAVAGPAAGAGSVTTTKLFSSNPARYLRAHGDNRNTGSPTATVYVTSRD